MEVKDEAAKRRKLEGHARAKQGTFSNWEDVIADHMGVDWRKQRASCDRTQWKNAESNFLDYTCRKLSSPKLSNQVATSSRIEQSSPDRRSKATYSFDAKGDFLPKPDRLFLNAWGLSRVGTARTFQIVVDCKPLKRVLCGHAVLERCM